MRRARERIGFHARTLSPELPLRAEWLEAAPSAQQLGQLPGRFHALGSDRKGQYAMDLDQGWRLILTFGATKEIVIVEEVTNHYDD